MVISIVFCKRLPEGIWDDDPWWVFHVEPPGPAQDYVPLMPFRRCSRVCRCAERGAWRPANAKGKKKNKLLTRKPPIFQFSSYKPPLRGDLSLDLIGRFRENRRECRKLEPPPLEELIKPWVQRIFKDTFSKGKAFFPAWFYGLQSYLWFRMWDLRPQSTRQMLEFLSGY
jgi:hypothetical protein